MRVSGWHIGVALAIPMCHSLCAVASAEPAAPAAPAASCGPAHTYIDAQSATVRSDAVVVVHGRRATLQCGGDDDSSYLIGKKITLTMAGDADVVVWRKPADPSKGTRTVPATALPTWLVRNRSEPIYKVVSARGSTKLVEQWHP